MRQNIIILLVLKNISSSADCLLGGAKKRKSFVTLPIVTIDPNFLEFHQSSPSYVLIHSVENKKASTKTDWTMLLWALSSQKNK